MQNMRNDALAAGRFLVLRILIGWRTTPSLVHRPQSVDKRRSAADQGRIAHKRV
jgi:hypothetical protein